jgi:hypothetical protein
LACNVVERQGAGVGADIGNQSDAHLKYKERGKASEEGGGDK